MNRKTLKRIVVMLVTLTILYGCSSDDDSHVTTEKPVEPLTVSGAMDWYNETVGRLEKQKSTTDNSKDISYKPSGKLAELFADEQWYAVESPLDFGDRNLMIMTPEVSNYADTNGDDNVKQVLKLVVLRNKETGETFSFIMAVVPELDYMLRKGDELDKATYLSPNSDLDGYVFFYTLDGELINGWLYKGGKVTGGINFSGEGPRTKILRAMYMEVRVCGYYEVECGGGGIKADCYSYIQVIYVDDGIGNPSSGGGVNNNGNPPSGGGRPGSGLPIKPLPIDDYEGAERIPETRTDCGENSTQNANAAENAMNSPDVMTSLNALREYAKNDENEWGMRIDFVDGKPKAYALHEGGTGSVPINFFEDTAYDLHSHPNETREGYHNYTGFSMGDIHGALQIGGEASFYNYKGSIVVAYDGSEYLLAINDRVKIQKFWGNDATKELFKPGKSAYFEDSKMDADYRKIRKQLEDNVFSRDNAHDYAMSYLLDKYNTGLKISKKEKGESSFKELKTEKNSIKSDYKPTKCP
ncbi:hypothetical protein [uncultured Dysgonomonas sp.]|uniref:DUF4329 domain-containing protein n=1 Tax=uncultured Dysgonomonas sp. TaxID=206096 RepID=A0A212JRK0_9BACT|nr:hypothetical protein [uncultured Dysgonomonas sp.]SBW02060.1 exported hypothetical protein [uncultured Dysgonomonas sp.]